MVVISWPKMRMEPESGSSRPLASLSSTDLPQPAGPRMMRVSPRSTEKEMFSSTGLTSKEMVTSLNSTTGNSTTGVWSPGGRTVAGPGVGMAAGMAGSASEDTDHGAGDEQVDDDDEDGGDDHSLGGGATYALGPAGGLHAEVAADGGDDETGEEGLGESLHDGAVDQAAGGVVQVGVGVEAEQVDGHQGPAGDAKSVRDDGEEEEHEDGGHDARSDQLANRIGAQGAHGVELLGNLHGADLRSHAGGVAAGDHEASEDGAEFLDHGERDQRASHGDGAELGQRGGRLEREDASGEEAGEDDDGHGTDADGVHLGEDIGPVVGRGKDVRDGRANQNGVLLHGCDVLLDVDLWRL